MNKAYFMILVAGLSFSSETAVQAANLDMNLASESAMERPLIQLDQSLLPKEILTLKSATNDDLSTQAIANALIRGLLVANRTQEIGYRALLSYRIQNVVRRLRRGESLDVAGNRSRVSANTLNRLMQLGQLRASKTLD
jgi:hypothetical protein